MNEGFRSVSEELEERFVQDGLATGSLELKGIRATATPAGSARVIAPRAASRVSMSDANRLNSIQDTVEFMEEFAAIQG